MTNDNSNGDGRNASDGRVYVSTGGSTGSIYDVAREMGINPNAHEDGPVIGGLHSGGVTNERNAEPVRAPTGPVDLGGGIEARRDGFRVTGGKLQAGDIVTLPGGVEVEYSMAVEHGLIHGDTSGDYRAAPEPGMDDGAEQQQPKSTRETDGLGPEAHDVMTTALARDEGAVINAAVDIIQSETGTLSESSMAELSDRLGVSSAEAQRHVDVAVAGYTRDAVTTVTKSLAVCSDLATEALSDARQSRPSEINEAMHRHVNEGKADVYVPFVQDYVAALGETDPQRCLAAVSGSGLKASLDNNGEVVVTIPGIGTMTWRDAVYGRHMRVSRNK